MLLSTVRWSITHKGNSVDCKINTQHLLHQQHTHIYVYMCLTTISKHVHTCKILCKPAIPAYTATCSEINTFAEMFILKSILSRQHIQRKGRELKKKNVWFIQMFTSNIKLKV